MKLKYILSCMAAVFLTSSATFAATLADWTFESSQPSGTNAANSWATNISAEVGIGTGAAFHQLASSAAPSIGNGSSHCYSLNNWSVGDSYQFAISGVGISNFIVSFDSISSSTGPRDFNFQYGTNGVNFTTFSTYTNGNTPSWSSSTYQPLYSHTNNLSSVTAINNAAVVYFRLVVADNTSSGGKTIGSGGTCRVDNFVVAASTGTVPTISGVSPSTLTTNAGNNVSFTVTLSAGDTPFYYYWYKGTVSPANLISGATNATLTLPYVLAADAGNYQVVVSNAISTATSDAVPLTVIDPAINVQPVSQQGLLGGAVQFHVSAAGTTNSLGALRYQWYFCSSLGDNTQIAGQVNNGTLGSGAVVSGATGSALMISNLTYADPTNFVVVVTGDNGSVTSSVASLTVAPSQVPLAFWNFNGYLDASNPAPYQGIGTASFTNCNPFAQTGGNGVDANDYQPGGGNYSWGTSNYPAGLNKQCGVQFNVSTVNAKDISLSFDIRATTTASKYFRLQFTTNGTDFIDYPSSDFVPSGDANTYESRNYSLVGFPNVANNPNFGVRIVTEFESTALYGTTNDANYVGVTNAYSPNGTISYDLVTFNADAIAGSYSPPTIGVIANIAIPDNASSNITLTVSGDTTGATAQSLNQNVLFANVSGNTLTLSPNGVDGVAPVLVTVVNANGDSVATWFYVTTVPANQPPTITGLADTNMLENGTLTIPFTMGDDHTDMSSVTPTLTSGNSTLAPIDGTHVTLGGSGTNRTLIITPVTNKFGAVPITVSVSDGLLNTSQTFVMEVRQNTNIVLVDHFDYDGGGAIDLLSGGLWSQYSGHTNEMLVGSGVLTVDGIHHTEDVNATLIGAPYATNSGAVLYSRFVLNYTTMPDATGSYFAYFKDTTTSNFLCRVWAFSNSPTTYRIAIANITNAVTSTVQFPQDLYPGSNYVVVSRLVLSNWNSTVWINPGSESAPSVTDTSDISTAATNITEYAFRESTADEGILTVSNLVVGLSFAAVTGIVPSAQLNIQLTNNQAMLTWSDSSFSLQSSTNVGGPYSTIGTAHSPSYTDSLTNAARFYRLIH
jgi:hypothetical protein